MTLSDAQSYYPARSLTVTILAWLQIVSGAVCSLAAFLGLLVVGGTRPFASLCISLFWLIQGIALRNRRNWARLLYIAGLGLGLVCGSALFLMRAFSLWDDSTGPVLAGLLLGMAINGLLLAKLTSLDVRAEFDA